MSDWPWKTPEATRAALAQLVASAFPEEQRPVRMREVAYRRLLARLFAARPTGWLVKGGVSLILRLDPNRTSNDVDVSFVGQAAGHAIAIEALRADAATDLGDFFTFVVGEGSEAHRPDGDHASLAVPVVARLGAKEWARFSVDLHLPEVELPAEELASQTPLTGRDAVDQVPGAVALALPQQIADKVCAVHEVHGVEGAPSSRARDLADLALIAAQVGGLDGAELVRRTADEAQRRRARGTLPAGLPMALTLVTAQEDDWRSRWPKVARGAPLGFDDALTVARAFVDPVLDGSATGGIWDPNLGWTRSGSRS
ncbi:MAG: nucleotidyl transferase AbiEii/AbiGii toxin family protein [Thermoleophilia bacterium]